MCIFNIYYRESSISSISEDIFSSISLSIIGFKALAFSSLTNCSYLFSQACLFGLKSSEVNFTKGCNVTTPPNSSFIMLLFFKIVSASLKEVILM